MPPRRRTKSELPPPVTSAPAAAELPKPRPRYLMQRMADGSERAERFRSRAQGNRDQALADFFGEAPALPVSANVRSMDSLLGEVLQGIDLEEEAMAPEILAEAWLKAVGPALASFSEFVSLSQGTACIRVLHSAARYQLTRLKPQMMSKLNAALGEGSVSRVRLIQ